MFKKISVNPYLVYIVKHLVNFVNMNLGKRVQLRRYEIGLTMRELAEKIGISHSAISVMESRDQKSSHHADKLAEALGVRIEWLIGGEEPMLPTQTIQAIDFLPDVALEADVIIEYIEEVDAGKTETYPVEKLLNYTHNIKSLRAVIARGEAMEPLICNGDTVLIDTSQKEIRDANIYAIKLNGLFLIKRMFNTYNGGFEVVSEDELFPPITIPPSDKEYLEIIGLAIYREGRIK